MTNYLYAVLIGLLCARLIVFVVLLGLGLCRAAALEVREDDGEYQ